MQQCQHTEQLHAGTVHTHNSTCSLLAKPSYGYLLLYPFFEEIKSWRKNSCLIQLNHIIQSPKGFHPSLFNLFKAPEDGNSQDKTFLKENPILSFKNMKIKHFEASFVFLSYEAIQ